MTRIEPGLLMQALHEINPYTGFQAAGLRVDLQGWNSERPIFRQILERYKPSLIVEVGVWKGASAIHMARVLKELGLGSPILAIDTWLGAWDFWDRDVKPGLYRALDLKCGHPSIYPQFLFNVISCGFENTIIPFPQTSTGAARWLKRKGVTAECIYLDAGHDEEDISQDLFAYYELLTPGGVLFGDDYADRSTGVACAVDQFAAQADLHVELGDEGQFWMIEKKAKRG